MIEKVCPGFSIKTETCGVLGSTDLYGRRSVIYVITAVWSIFMVPDCDFHQSQLFWKFGTAKMHFGYQKLSLLGIGMTPSGKQPNADKVDTLYQ
jgi:hypothetical protein